MNAFFNKSKGQLVVPPAEAAETVEKPAESLDELTLKDPSDKLLEHFQRTLEDMLAKVTSDKK